MQPCVPGLQQQPFCEINHPAFKVAPSATNPSQNNDQDHVSLHYMMR